jgi:SAM-dependent methyltransferase
MVKFVVDFAKTGTPPAPDGRLDAPAFHRNHEAIWSTIAPFLGTQTGDVLELGSGTGQHAVTFARRAPQLLWWPSDIFRSHLESIAAWRQHEALPNLRAPQYIDLTVSDWRWQGGEPSDRRITAILCINVLHISPWRVSQNLFTGAGRLLRDDGRLFLYGPFMHNGAHTAPSNAGFDATLRAENREWGVRDIRNLRALADQAGLSLTEITAMPANNLVLAFARALRQN